MALPDIYLDTAYVQARLNRNDQFHQRAVQIAANLPHNARFWISKSVLIEVGDALCGINREAAVAFIRSCYTDARFRVVAVDQGLLTRGLELYASRIDKEWSLTDCISFVVMQDNQILEALTLDRNFVQAGYRALMLVEE